jgi:hypothetical protein
MNAKTSLTTPANSRRKLMTKSNCTAMQPTNYHTHSATTAAQHLPAGQQHSGAQ